nr:helix-turn-helix transcriptional regulator [Armatimonas rosea]
MSSALESAGLGQWIKQKRLGLGLSLRELAELAGIAHSSLDKAERGGGMRDSTLELVVRALAGEGASEEEVTALSREARAVRAGLETEYVPDEDRIFFGGRFDNLPPDRKARVEELANELAALTDLENRLRDLERKQAIGGTGEPKEE